MGSRFSLEVGQFWFGAGGLLLLLVVGDCGCGGGLDVVLLDALLLLRPRIGLGVLVDW